MANLGNLMVTIGANTAGLTTGLNEARGKLSSFGGSIKDLIANFASSGGLSLAIAGATIALTELASAFIEGSKAEQIAKQSLAEYNQELAKTGGELAKETESITALLNVAQDETQSRQTRLNALQQAQKEYPGYLGNIKLEEVNSEMATNAINRLTEALQRKLKVQALTNLIEKTQEQIIETGNKGLIEQTTLWDKIVAAGSGQTAVISLINAGYANQTETLDALQTQYDKYVKQLNEVTAAQSAAGDFQGLKPDKVKEVKDKVDQVAEALRRYKNAIAEVDLFSRGDILKDLQNKFQATETVIKRLIDLKVPVNGGPVGSLVEQAKDLQKQIQQVEDRLKALKNFQPLVAGTPAQLNNPTNAIDEGLNRSGSRIAGLQSMFNTDTEDKWYKKLAKDSRQLFRVYEDIANALTDVFASIFKDGKISLDSIGQALTNLIAQLAQAAIRAAILAALLSAVGFGVGPSGTLTKGLNGSFGSIFGNLLGSGGGNLFGHAAGGVFTGPTLIGNHLFGEAGPEALIPLDRLGEMTRNMGGGNNIEVTGRLEIDYNKLAIAIERKDRYRTRNYGNG